MRTIIEMKDTVEKKLLKSTSIKIRLDYRTFINNISIFHCLILPLHDFANIKPKSKQIALRVDKINNLRLQNIDNPDE